MTLWWIGNAALLFAVVPVMVLLLRGVLTAAFAVRRTAGRLAVLSSAMVTDLDPVSELTATETYVRETTAGLTRYGNALDRLL